MRTFGKRILILVVIVLLVGLLTFPVSAGAGPVPISTSDVTANGPLKSSTDIIENAKDLSGKVIVYEGEIIGDIMQRGDHVWINVSDGSNAIGIWLTAEQAKGLTTAGRYDTRGDTVKISGKFSRACPEHGGDYDIHAQSVVKVQSGFAVEHPVRPWLVIVSIGLLLASLIVLLMYRQQKHSSAGRWILKLMTPVGSRLRLR